jgi:hypothetical protein
MSQKVVMNSMVMLNVNKAAVAATPQLSHRASSHISKRPLDTLFSSIILSFFGQQKPLISSSSHSPSVKCKK